MLKRIIAGVLSVSLIVSAAATGKLNSLVAEQPQPSAEGPQKNSAVSVTGNNSLGKLVGDAFNEQQNEGIRPLSAAADEMTFRIADIMLDRDAGKITVCSTQSLRCDLTVSVIDDDDPDHVIRFSKPVGAGTDVVTEFDIMVAELPEFFSVKAVLTDNSGRELSGEEFFNQYTHFKQTILNSTVEDFEEQYVVNLDDDETTNFFVLSEDTVVAESSEEVNTLVSADYDNNVFVFDNPDETILSLQAGECFYAQPNSKDIIAVSVESIENTDDGVVIRGSDASEEIFDFVKIESDGSSASAPELVDPDEESNGLYEGYLKGEDGLLLNYSSNILSDNENKFSITNYIPIDIEKSIELNPEIDPLSFKEKFKEKYKKALMQDGASILDCSEYEDPLSTEKKKTESHSRLSWL